MEWGDVLQWFGTDADEATACHSVEPCTLTCYEWDYVNRSASRALTGKLLFEYKDIKPEIVHALLLREYGVAKKWAVIMDKTKDSNVASTPAKSNRPSAQDRCCATSLGGGTKKRRGNGEG